MVMVGPLPVAELCDPTGAPFTFTHLSYVSGYRCADALTSGSVQFSVLALSQSDIDWFDTSKPSVRCGQTRTINDQSSIDVIVERANAANWQDNAQTVATGSGGSCDAAGDYTGSVLIELK
jgi:hypothetical protein